MSKKAQGLSMNVIIIAAIALLILIILAVLILRAGRGVSDQTGCVGIGGFCSDDPCREVEGGIYIKNMANSGKSGGCADEQDCCVELIETGEVI